MLLQFVVENYLSFRDKAVLSMVAADGVDHREEHVLRVPGLPPVLKCAAIYGANASGKSNLVKALDFALGLVNRGRASGEPIGVRPFKLDDESATKPSRFEFEIYAGGKHYSYGFLASAQRIDAEWLVLVDGKEDVELFDRTVAEPPDKPLIHIHDAMSGDAERRQFLRFVAEGTRPNQLFLKELKERNFGELGHVFAWFVTFLIISSEVNYYASHDIEQNEDDRVSIADFLRNVDTGISDIRTFRAPAKVSELPDDTMANLKKMSLGVDRSGESVVANESSGDPEIVKIRLQHQGKERATFFDLHEESDGTRRLLALLSHIHLFRRYNLHAAIDELERSLHPLLTNACVRTFLAGSTGQLIFTTHDTNLLDQALLPPDSTWFVEKNPEGASTLHSLAEYKGEQLEHIKSLERGYLQGRFGGIPLIRTRRAP